MAEVSTCLACGSALEASSQLNAVCSNANCSGGRHFYLCGHCRKYSFSIASGSCINATCPTYHLQRDMCPACRTLSQVQLENEALCMNRRCPGHEGRLSICDSCGNRSLADNDRYLVCLKSDCATALKPRLKSRPPPQPLSLAPAPAPTPETVAESAASEDSDPWGFGSGPQAIPSRTQARVVEAERAQAAPDITAPPANEPKTAPPTPAATTEDPFGLEGVAASPDDRFASSVDDHAATQAPTPQPMRDVAVTQAPTPQLAQNAEAAVAPGAADPIWGSTAPTASSSQPTIELPPQLPPPAAPPPSPVVLPEAPEEEPAPAGPAADESVITEELPLPEVSPVTAAQNRSRPTESGRPEGELSEIELAYEFIRRTLTEEEGGALSPVFLVFGLAGSGKSTFLTMLGDMLAKGATKYHFPYPGVSVRSIQVDQLIDQHWGDSASVGDRRVIQRRVRDLTFDYASENYENYLINGTWVPATERESIDDDKVASFFLVTELVREGATIGRIVTMETSGEDYLEILQRIGSVRKPEDLTVPLHRVLYQLFQAATGVVILLDPDWADNDQAYHHLFRIVKEGIEGRAAQSLEHLVDEYLQAESSERDAVPDLEDVIRSEIEQEAFERRRQQVRDKLAADMRTLQGALAEAEPTHAGVADLVSRHKTAFDEFATLLKVINPNFQQRSDQLFAEHGRTVANFLRYYGGLVREFAQAPVFDRAVDELIALQDRRAQDRDQVIDRIGRELGLAERLHEAFIDRWSGRDVRSNLRYLPYLRYLSLVVTKSDRHPTVYPPCDYPKFKLPTSNVHLQSLGAYLKLIGGFLHCYNATAIGYSVQRGDQYAPGPGNSFTPVNIIEPIFDMMLGEVERRD